MTEFDSSGIKIEEKIYKLPFYQEVQIEGLMDTLQRNNEIGSEDEVRSAIDSIGRLDDRLQLLVRELSARSELSEQ